MPRYDHNDVLVIGSGVAGLCAALEAAERGCATLVVDSESEPGGASMHSGGACCIVGTDLQERSGVSDSIDLALADWRRTGGERADLSWARSYLEASHKEVYHWAQACGIAWQGPDDAEGNSVPRLHQPVGAGRAIVTMLLGRLCELAVPVRLRTRAEKLLFEDGRVTGASVCSERGEMDLSARQTIVCTGGFVNAPEMLAAHVPDLARFSRVLCGGWKSARGLGHAMLTTAGAAFVSLGSVWMYPVGTPNPRDSDDCRGLVVRGLRNEIWVNRSAERFHDESLRGGRSGIAALMDCPDQTCWGICDAREAANLRLLDDERYGSALASTPAQRDAFFTQSGHAFQEQTVAALAQRVGLHASALERTIGRFNDDVARGFDTAFGRDVSSARPIAGDYFCAIQYFPIVQKNLGGVVTDLDGRVLGLDGRSIPGLLAGGEVAGMAGGCINGEGALEGTMFGPSLFSGRIAGQAAARAR